MNQSDENLNRLIDLVNESRDLWYLNEVQELSEQLYAGLSGGALRQEFLRQSIDKDTETKRKATLAYEYVLIRQMFEDQEEVKQGIELLMQTEPSLSNLEADVALVGMDYIGQCIEQQKLLVPKEMDKIVLDRYAQSYDNLIFYDKPFVTLVHQVNGGCKIHTIKDETGAAIGKIDLVGKTDYCAEGTFSIMTHSVTFSGSIEQACEYVREKQTDPNIISTSSEVLCNYVVQRYIHMRIWNTFKDFFRDGNDGISIFKQADVDFLQD